ncbi:hypothetical protein B0T20DRAFT_88678 [Sordaria brevicollis]|uniref:Uncharacterized protein n=1 Tax=Sordaria brevicollis TaxID=83679 RepID=A0AAE0U362_SORBR|nr:hypothetical protein B0T20DRAFT_88678 [Sordaria brevicollis]
MVWPDIRSTTSAVRRRRQAIGTGWAPLHWSRPFSPASGLSQMKNIMVAAFVAHPASTTNFVTSFSLEMGLARPCRGAAPHRVVFVPSFISATSLSPLVTEIQQPSGVSGSRPPQSRSKPLDILHCDHLLLLLPARGEIQQRYNQQTLASFSKIPHSCFHLSKVVT